MSTLQSNLPRKILCATFCTLLISLIAWIVSPYSNVSAASCYAETCTGYNPETMGCSADATSTGSKTQSGAFIEERLSNTCNAAWERTKNVSGSSKYAAGSEKYGCANYCYSQNVSTTGKIATGSLVYTPMKGPARTTPTLPCGRVSDSVISVPIPNGIYCLGY